MTTPIRLIPTRTQVQNLTVGQLALNCFGNYAEVVSITGQGNDINGKAYVCFTLRFGPHSTISQSYKEGELVITTALSREYTSAQLDMIERKMNNA